MIKVGLGIVLLACVTTPALTACTAPPSCSRQVHAIESTVHTGGLWTSVALPNVDSLANVHWIGHPRSSECSREVGPTDWWYQAVVPLTTGETTGLTQSWSWRPVAPTTSPAPPAGSSSYGADRAAPTELVPDLDAYLPVGNTWARSQTYEQALPSSESYAVFLDAAHNVLLIFAFDD